MQTSFKDSARSELLGVLPQKRNEIIAFLSALAKTCGSIEIAKKRYNLCFWLADYDEGLKVVELLKILYPADFELSLDKTKTAQRRVRCKCRAVFQSKRSKISDLCKSTLTNI